MEWWVGGEIGLTLSLDVASQLPQITAVVNDYGVFTTYKADIRSLPTE